MDRKKMHQFINDKNKAVAMNSNIFLTSVALSVLSLTGSGNKIGVQIQSNTFFFLKFMNVYCSNTNYTYFLIYRCSTRWCRQDEQRDNYRLTNFHNANHFRLVYGVGGVCRFNRFDALSVLLFLFNSPVCTKYCPNTKWLLLMFNYSEVAAFTFLKKFVASNRIIFLYRKSLVFLLRFN